MQHRVRAARRGGKHAVKLKGLNACEEGHAYTGAEDVM